MTAKRKPDLVPGATVQFTHDGLAVGDHHLAHKGDHATYTGPDPDSPPGENWHTVTVEIDGVTHTCPVLLSMIEAVVD